MPQQKVKARSANPRLASEATEYYEAYVYFARILRVWLIAYGVGAPFLVLSNESLRQALAASRHAYLIVGLFLAGVVLQILCALIYKYAMWHLYYGAAEGGEEHRRTRLYRISDRVSESHALEFAFDATSIIVLGVATVLACCAILK
jgi:hypothetical protein